MIRTCIACVVLGTFLVPIAFAQDAGKQLDEHLKYLRSRLDEQETYIIKTMEAIGKLKEQKENDASAVAKLDQLQKDFGDQSDALKSLGTSVDEVKKQAADGQKTEAEIKALNAKLDDLTAQVKTKSKEIQWRGEQVDKFKFQTRMKLTTHGREYRVELESIENGKTIPLAGKALEILEQFKDGEPTAKDSIVTDERGLAAFERRRTTSDEPRGLWVICRFAGDDLHRACQERERLK